MIPVLIDSEAADAQAESKNIVTSTAVTATPIPVYQEAGIVSVRGGVDAPDFTATPNLAELDRILAELRA